jgi:hypothetical protein
MCANREIIVVAINQFEWEHGGLRRFSSYALVR